MRQKFFFPEMGFEKNSRGNSCGFGFFYGSDAQKRGAARNVINLKPPLPSSLHPRKKLAKRAKWKKFFYFFVGDYPYLKNAEKARKKSFNHFTHPLSPHKNYRKNWMKWYLSCRKFFSPSDKCIRKSTLQNISVMLLSNLPPLKKIALFGESDILRLYLSRKNLN